MLQCPWSLEGPALSLQKSLLEGIREGDQELGFAPSVSRGGVDLYDCVLPYRLREPCLSNETDTGQKAVKAQMLPKEPFEGR